MAANITSSSSPLFLVNPNPNPIKRTSKSRRVLIFAKQDSQNPFSSLIRVVGSSMKTQKVFEDKSSGVVCFVNDQGEITCEGYDEGPRLDHDFSRFYSHQIEKQDFIRLLERGLLQVTDSGKVN